MKVPKNSVKIHYIQFFYTKTLGHSSIAITEQVYAHLLPRKIADATTEAVSNMLKGKA